MLFRIEYQRQYVEVAENERLQAFSQYLVSRYEAGMDTRDFRPPNSTRRDFPTFSIRDMDTGIRVFSTREGDKAEKEGQFSDYVSPSGGHYRLYYYINTGVREEVPYPFVLALLALLVTAGFSWFLTSLITRPLLKLKTYVQGLGGDLASDIEPALLQRNDEFGSLAKAVDEMSLRIRHLIDSKQQLFYDVSHELRAPLARMQVAAEIVRMRAESAGDDTKIYDRVDREINALNQLITELMMFAKEDNAQFPIEEADLKTLLVDVVGDQAFSSSEHRVQLSINCSKPAKLRTKRVLVERALKNLLENAIKYSPDDAAVEVVLNKSAARFEILVRDSGPGIPEEKLEFVTQPFTRLHSESVEGVGLGLSIVQRAVTDLGGKLFLSNRKSGGLEARIELPV